MRRYPQNDVAARDNRFGGTGLARGANIGDGFAMFGGDSWIGAQDRRTEQSQSLRPAPPAPSDAELYIGRRMAERIQNAWLKPPKTATIPIYGRTGTGPPRNPRFAESPSSPTLGQAPSFDRWTIHGRPVISIICIARPSREEKNSQLSTSSSMPKYQRRRFAAGSTRIPMKGLELR